MSKNSVSFNFPPSPTDGQFDFPDFSVGQAASSGSAQPTENTPPREHRFDTNQTLASHLRRMVIQDITYSNDDDSLQRLAGVLKNSGRDACRRTLTQVAATCPELINRTDQQGNTLLTSYLNEFIEATSSENTARARYRMRLLHELGADPRVADRGNTSATLQILKNWTERMDDKGNLTKKAALAVEAYVCLHPPAGNKKFALNYKASDVDSRMEQEDEFALKMLESSDARTAVTTVAALSADYFEALNAGGHAFNIEKINKDLAQHKTDGEYASLDHQFGSFSEMADFLRTGKLVGKEAVPEEWSHVYQVSLLWLIASAVPESQMKREVNAVYRSVISGTKDYIKKPFPELRATDQFGNSKEEFSEMFDHPPFILFYRGLQYIGQNTESSNFDNERYLREKIPYIYGLSGMANSAMRLLDVLGLTPDDAATGKPFCDALAAYIIGSGTHSYPEVHDVFNLHLSLIEGRKEKSDYISTCANVGCGRWAISWPGD